ncbi:MAG TPA: IlvD/Edd family dehydratase [Bryobacteraceae bacterium]|nr:IlvD/Edd family dehydratase [Bryobacteraceae bacterium]
MSANEMKLRSRQWFQEGTYESLMNRASVRAQGFTADVFENRPVIGICNSWSELVHCNVHLRAVAEAVKRGVWAAGGFPLEFPTISLGEYYMRPTTMLYRNLMAMDVEESIRANPLDGVVLLCGCDKTIPAQLMGAASADLPAIMVPGGPMLSGQWGGRTIGAGTDTRRLFEQFRAGRVTEQELCEVEGGLLRSPGHCNVMGTASTMSSLAEAMGLALPGCANVPGPDARRLAMAEQSGRRIVEAVWEDLRPSRIVTPAALRNAIAVDMALGGSTNAVVHLIAIAGRLGIDLPLAEFDRISRRTPYLANVKPSGEYLMEDFYYAGGLPALMKEILPLLDGTAITITGKSVAENVATAECHNRSVIRAAEEPLHAEGGTVVLHGNLAPDGAVLKQTAASPHLLRHRGKAYVFENYQHMRAQIDSEDLPVDAPTVLVMKNCGPRGGPGFPEWGHIPMPRVLLQRDITDMVRISDARMSGTSFGTVLLHLAPESAVGGPLAAVQTGDEISLDVPARRVDLCLSSGEIERRLAGFVPAPAPYERGYGKLFLDHITQANLGCDFDFLRAVK